VNCKVFILGLGIVLLSVSCGNGKWQNFNAQKHTKLGKLKSNKEQANQDEGVAEVDIDYTPLSEKELLFEDEIELIEPALVDSLEFESVSDIYCDEVSFDLDHESVVQREVISHEFDGNNKHSNEHNRRPAIGWNWLTYSLLIALSAVIFVAGWYTLALEGSAFGGFLIILGVLMMIGVLIHALVKLNKSGGSPQRRRLFLFSLFLSLGIITFLLAFYWTA
jgi:hypothetical protein